MDFPKIIGAGRVADSHNSLLITLDRRPTDDDIWLVQDFLNNPYLQSEWALRQRVRGH